MQVSHKLNILIIRSTCCIYGYMCLLLPQWQYIFYSKYTLFHCQTNTLVKRISLSNIFSVQMFLFFLLFCFELVKTEQRLPMSQLQCCCFCSELCRMFPEILPDKEIVSRLFCAFTCQNLSTKSTKKLTMLQTKQNSLIAASVNQY